MVPAVAVPLRYSETDRPALWLERIALLRRHGPDTAAAVAAAVQTLRAVPEVPGSSSSGFEGRPSGVNSFVMDDGDSSCATNGSPDGMRWIDYMIPALNRSVVYTSTCVSGETLATAVSSFATHVMPLYSPSYGAFVVNIVAGANDIRASSSATTIYGLFQQYVNLVHALGPNAKVIVPAYPIQCDISGNAPENAVLQALNNMVYAGWSLPQSQGGLGADGLANYFGNPTVGNNSYVPGASAYCNAMYSSDGQHLNDLGKSIMGPVEVPAVAPLVH